MSKKSIDSNKQFMIGNGILAFGVFFVVCLFLYLAFRSQPRAEHPEAFRGAYTLRIAESFAGDSLSVYINDSLLLDRRMGNAAIKLQVDRFSEENLLMVVDNLTEEITPFNLNPEGSSVNIEKKNGKVFIEETEAATGK